MNEDLISIDNFFKKYPLKKYSKKDTIISSGSEIKSVFFVKSGIVRSFYIDEKGSELTINLLKPSSFFPLSTILAGKEIVYDFQAFTDVEINIAPIRETFEFLDRDIDFKNILIKKFSSGLEGYLIRSFFLIKGSAMQKVASTFLMLLGRFGKEERGQLNIDIPITHQDIADLSGITRETASIQIKILENAKFISRKGKKTIVLDLKKLSEKANLGDEINLPDLSF